MPRKRWWSLNGRFDPTGHWRALDIPCLMIFGELDRNVDVARSLQRLESAGILDGEIFSTKVWPGLGHGLIRDDSGWLDGAYLDTMARFIGSGAAD
jgi:pimeloyl-ACP methyl ester carboxylesterase